MTRSLSTLLVITLLLACNTASRAATNTAASPSFADVSAALSLCVHGDTVLVPPGLATWTNETITTSKRVRFLGSNTGTFAGADYTSLTTIRRGSGSAAPLFFFTTVGLGTNLFGVQRLTLDASDTPATSLVTVGGSLTQTNRYWRVAHCEFLKTKFRAIRAIGRSEGLVDNNYFTMPFDMSAEAVSVEGFQRAGSAATNSANATTAPALGTITNFVYVEANYFDSAFKNGSAVEWYWDAQACVRSNFVKNTVLGIHNTDPSRSATVWEIYGNTCTNFGVSGGPWCLVRSGWGVYYGNRITNTFGTYVATPRLTIYRASGTNVFPNYYPAIVVTGTNRFDGNLTNTLTIGYPAYDQPGWGDPTAWSPTNGVQTLHGCYSWDNSFNGSTNASVCGFDVKYFCATGPPHNCNAGLTAYDGIRDCPDTAALCVEGRDFFNQTQKPGYVPLVYPHPFADDSPQPPQPPSLPGLPGRSILLLR